MNNPDPPPPDVEVFILAGGLSSRMGRDKAGLRLGRQTMLARIRATARQTGYRVRVIRRDCVPRCGPIGGIYTGLRRGQTASALFLACDMPFLSASLLRDLVARFNPSTTALFADGGQGAGFPCLLRREYSLPVVARQIATGAYSLRRLAEVLNAVVLPPIPANSEQLANLNLPAEFTAARARYRTGLTRVNRPRKD